MGLIRAAFGPVSNISDDNSWMMQSFGRGAMSKAGVSVSENSALQCSAYFAAIRILSETLAQVPFSAYRKLPKTPARPYGGSEEATDHGAYWILQEPNERMTGVILRETAQAHRVAWGNCYIEVERTGLGEPVGLHLLYPDCTWPEVTPDRFVYFSLLNGQQVRIPYEDVIHIPGLGFNGVIGYSPVALQREALGLFKATETFGANFFSKGAKSGVIISHPGDPGSEAVRAFKKAWQEDEAGLDNAHGVRVLREGMKPFNVTIPPEDAQFLETRKFQVVEIARFNRIQLHLLQDMEGMKYSNVEQAANDFVQQTMMPHWIKWEAEFDRKLFTRAERRAGYYVKHNVNGLLRGDTTARSEYFQKAVGGPWMTQNECRALEELNPVDGGDQLMKPLNMSALKEENSSHLVEELAPLVALQINQLSNLDIGSNGHSKPI